MDKIFQLPNLEDDFRQKGFVTSFLLSSDESANLLEQFYRTIPNENDLDQNGKPLHSITFHATHYHPDSNYRRKARFLIQDFFAKKIEQVLSSYEIIHCNFMVKAPGQGFINAHQHPPLLKDFNQKAVTIWCPLVDSDETNGTLQVIEGSHNILSEIPLPFIKPCFRDFEPILFEKYMTPIPVKAGVGVIFDDNLIHGSEKNNSSEFRPAVQITCAPIDAQLIYLFESQNPSESDFEMYEINKEFFLEHSIDDLVKPAPNLKRIGTVKNTNRPISEQEFSKLLKSC